MNIVFIGFKSVGKTSYGNEYARLKGIEFIDSDLEIERLHYEESGEKIGFKDIYSKHGRSYFLDLEKRVLEGLVKVDDKVIALGGGAAINFPNLVKNIGKVVLLVGDKNTIFSYMEEHGFPHFVDLNDKRGSFEKEYDKREGIYESIADAKIEIAGIAPKDVGQKILEELDGK